MPFLEEGGYFDLPIKVALLNTFDIAAASPFQQMHNPPCAFTRNNKLLY